MGTGSTRDLFDISFNTRYTAFNTRRFDIPIYPPRPSSYRPYDVRGGVPENLYTSGGGNGSSNWDSPWDTPWDTPWSDVKQTPETDNIISSYPVYDFGIPSVPSAPIYPVRADPPAVVTPVLSQVSTMTTIKADTGATNVLLEIQSQGETVASANRFIANGETASISLEAVVAANIAADADIRELIDVVVTPGASYVNEEPPISVKILSSNVCIVNLPPQRYRPPETEWNVAAAFISRS